MPRYRWAQLGDINAFFGLMLDNMANLVILSGILIFVFQFPEDIVYTDVVSGIHANFIASTVPKDFAPDRSPDGAKRWRDIWSAGQGVGLIERVEPIGAIVEALAKEAHDTIHALG